MSKRSTTKSHRYYHFLITRGLTSPNQFVRCKDCGQDVYASSNTLKANSDLVVVGTCPSCSSELSMRKYALDIAERDGCLEGRKIVCGCGLILAILSTNPFSLDVVNETENEDDINYGENLNHFLNGSPYEDRDEDETGNNIRIKPEDEDDEENEDVKDDGEVDFLDEGDDDL